MNKEELNYRLIEPNCCANCNYPKTFMKGMINNEFI